MFLALSIAVIIVHAADVGYTTYAIARYGMREWNGLWRWLSHSPAWFAIASTAWHIAALVGLYAIHVPAWALAIGLFVRVVVCIRNVNVVKGRIRRKG